MAYKTKVRLTVFDEDGNEIEKLVDEERNPGTYEVEFQSCSRQSALASGDYLYRLKAGDYSSEKKMVLENESSQTH